MKKLFEKSWFATQFELHKEAIKLLSADYLKNLIHKRPLTCIFNYIFFKDYQV